MRARARSITWLLRNAWRAAPVLLVGIVSVTLLRSLLPAGLAWVAKELIDAVTRQAEGGAPDAGGVLPWVWVAFGLALAEVVLDQLGGYLDSRLADDLNLEVTTDILNHAASLDLEFFEDVAKQDSLNRAMGAGANQFVGIIKQTFSTISSVIQVTSLVVILGVIQPWTWVVVVVLIPPFLLVRWTQARRHYELEYERATKRRWTQYFISLLTKHLMVAETAILGLAPLLIRNYRGLAGEFRDQNRGMYRASVSTTVLFSTLTAAAFFGLLLELTLRALDGDATLGDVAVFFAASARLRGGITSGVGSFTSLLKSSLHVSALVEFFETRGTPAKGKTTLPSSSPGSINIEDLHFTYAGSNHPVLRGLSLSIEAGETVALVGENGAGKSTLVKLLARLYTPDRGHISIDGHDLAELDLQSLHRQISFVFQHFTRYEGTAAENIAYGNWERCLDRPDRIEEIARAAGVHEMVEGLSNGYDTVLGRSFGTHEMSGGQWQRLAVARAFARPSSLLILDEPTASLDARAEYELFKRTRQLAHGKTTILISHRFSTVRIADRIAVIDGGHIVEDGTHEQLLEAGGYYANLYQLHMRQLNLPSSAETAPRPKPES